MTAGLAQFQAELEAAEAAAGAYFLNDPHPWWGRAGSSRRVVDYPS